MPPGLRWQYHVAVIVAVRTEQGVRPMVLDPALFTDPVALTDWKTALSTGLSDVQRKYPKADIALTLQSSHLLKPHRNRDDDAWVFAAPKTFRAEDQRVVDQTLTLMRQRVPFEQWPADL